MKFRSRANRRGARRDFTRTAMAINKKNTPHRVMRGGYRL